MNDFGVSRLGLDTQTRSSLPPRDSLPPRLIAVSSSTGGSFAGSDDATGIIAPGVIRNRDPRVTSAVTEVGMLVGTPAYMAPELGLGPDRLSARADVFSLGMIAFELLTGKRPFDVSPALERLQGMSVPPASSIGAVVANLPADVVTAIDDALAFDPVRRPTARAFAKAMFPDPRA